MKGGRQEVVRETHKSSLKSPHTACKGLGTHSDVRSQTKMAAVAGAVHT